MVGGFREDVSLLPDTQRKMLRDLLSPFKNEPKMLLSDGAAQGNYWLHFPMVAGSLVLEAKFKVGNLQPQATSPSTTQRRGQVATNG